MPDNLFAKLFAVFLVTQLIGIGVGTTLIGEIAAGTFEQPTIVTENPDDPINALALIVSILVFTGVLLAFMTLFKGAGLFRIMEVFVIFSASLIVFGSFIPEAAFVLAIELVALKALFPKNVWIRNIAAIIAVAGVGALIGVSLGVIPVLIFLILL